MNTRLVAASPQTPPTPETQPARPRMRSFTAWFFLVLVGYQTFHQIEHTIETVHLHVEHRAEANTLLGGIDFEWLHFGANALLLYGLVAVILGAGPDVRRRLRTERRFGWYAMVAAVVVQSYHVFDHVVRLVEYVSSGGEVPNGTLTRVVDPIWFHFGINLTVLVGMYAAFFGLRVHRSLLPWRRTAPGVE